ncbi:hypothetical protein GLE_1219 [Lysobacter enzymogenes]|uniref:Uncharacterized protein n=1 Tax=Lysobacter enzymogenes TaxID=69 RepID=A0A0S2DDJ8_LYSEN|nr:hypothetical protein [Lysobacter enzymogenes]ALN56576.1 hypothetical protein GLE_1219 [Lysobacter enzymogenes]QCW25383.1 hypothetical protein FE772_06610 [Lysobacter enzymogenes]
MENAPPDAVSSSHAGKRLSILATLSIATIFPGLLFALLRVGRNCAIQDIFAGDNEAASLKLFSVTLIYAGAALALSRLNRRLGFYPVLGAVPVLIGVAAVYGFPLALVPAGLLAIVSFLMWKGRYHCAPIQKWLAIALLVPGAFAVLIIVLNIRMELLYRFG